MGTRKGRTVYCKHDLRRDVRLFPWQGFLENIYWWKNHILFPFSKCCEIYFLNLLLNIQSNVQTLLRILIPLWSFWKSTFKDTSILHRIETSNFHRKNSYAKPGWAPRLVTAKSWWSNNLTQITKMILSRISLKPRRKYSNPAYSCAYWHSWLLQAKVGSPFGTNWPSSADAALLKYDWELKADQAHLRDYCRQTDKVHGLVMVLLAQTWG